MLTDIGEWKRWNPRVKSSTINDELKIGSGFRCRAPCMATHNEIHGLKINERIAWHGSQLGKKTNYRWHLEAQSRGVQVHVRAEQTGWRADWFKGAGSKKLKENLMFWLATIKAEAERNSDFYQSIM